MRKRISVARPAPRGRSPDYEAQHALHTLREADRIKGDPKLMARAREEAKRNMEATAHRPAKPARKSRK